jgi:hypothetical protein
MTILEEHGYFWWHDEPVPDQQFAPQSAISGVLKIDDDGRITLDMNGFLPSTKGPLALLANTSDARVPSRCIQGILKGNSKRVLLTNLWRRGGRFTSYGISYEEYSAENCFVGDDAFRPGTLPPLFRSLVIRLERLEEWLRLGDIHITRSKRGKIAARYKPPKDIVYRIDESRLTVRYDILAPMLGHRSDSLTLKEAALLIWKPERRQSLEDLKAQFSKLEDLFILLTNSDISLQWPRVSVSEDVKYTWYFLRNRISSLAPRANECWTNFIQLRESFGRIVGTWIKNREAFGPGYYLYLGTRRGITLYPEHRFVNLLWGIEAFHRKKYPDPQSKWTAHKGQRRRPNGPSLAHRISQTFKALPIGLDKKRLNRFSNDCASLRNEISHYGGQEQPGDYGKFIVNLTTKSDALSTLYHALLLHEIGVEDSVLLHWIYKGPQSFAIGHNFAEVGLFDKPAMD